MARTGLCMQYEVAAIHNLGQGAWGLHRRAQGLSLPRQLQVLHGDVHCVGLSVTASTHTHTHTRCALCRCVCNCLYTSDQFIWIGRKADVLSQWVYLLISVPDKRVVYWLEAMRITVHGIITCNIDIAFACVYIPQITVVLLMLTHRIYIYHNVI